MKQREHVGDSLANLDLEFSYFYFHSPSAIQEFQCFREFVIETEVYISANTQDSLPVEK